MMSEHPIFTVKDMSYGRMHRLNTSATHSYALPSKQKDTKKYNEQVERRFGNPTEFPSNLHEEWFKMNYDYRGDKIELIYCTKSGADPKSSVIMDPIPFEDDHLALRKLQRGTSAAVRMHIQLTQNKSNKVFVSKKLDGVIVCGTEEDNTALQLTRLRNGCVDGNVMAQKSLYSSALAGRKTSNN
jgi:hypothetical protein